MAKKSSKKTKPNSFNNIDHVAIVVKDMQETISFYEEFLGFAIEREFGNEELGVRATVLKRKTSRIELFEYKKGNKNFCSERREIHGIKVPRSYFEPGIKHIAFRTSAFERTVKDLNEIGLNPSVQPRKGYSGDSITFYRDPNGVLLEMVSPLKRVKKSGKKEATASKR